MQARYTQQLSAIGFLGTEIVTRYTSAYELNMRKILMPVLDGDGILRVRWECVLGWTAQFDGSTQRT